MPVLAAALCFHVAARLWSFIRDSCPLLLRCNETHPPNCPIKRGSERVTFRRADVRMFWWPSSQRLYFDCAADKTESGKKKKKVPWLHFKTKPGFKLFAINKKKKKKGKKTPQLGEWSYIHMKLFATHSSAKSQSSTSAPRTACESVAVASEETELQSHMHPASSTALTHEIISYCFCALPPNFETV